uniref:Uncharacterized protein n=1 Tax=Arundo donax TaxID=35708 RepID=A0A0A9DID5_ARUDO
MAAMHAPVCTICPTLPTCSEDDTAAMFPTILTARVLSEMMLGASTPLR